MHPVHPLPCDLCDSDEALFVRIAEDLAGKGWSVIPDALPAQLSSTILAQLQTLEAEQFSPAGIGRRADHAIDPAVRRDEIHWIEGRGAAEQDWLRWSDSLRLYLNRRLFLGLTSFESHFAHYPPGAFYRRHVDAFREQPLKAGSNRILSLVAYFNAQWSQTDGGELVLYEEDCDESMETVMPILGTLVVFLSAEVPHEVRPARRDRFSIAGWFRGNTTDD